MRVAFAGRALRTGLGINPCVAVRDLRCRMRGTRAFVLLLTYVLFACGTVVLVLGLLSLSSPAGAPRGSFLRPFSTAMPMVRHYPVGIHSSTAES